MSRHHPPVLSLAILFALSTLLFAAAGCGGDSQEQELKEATAAVAAKREAVQEARETVDARQQAVEEAQAELDAAKQELAAREQALREAESQVGSKATDAALFRSVQRRILDDEELDELLDDLFLAVVRRHPVDLRYKPPGREPVECRFEPFTLVLYDNGLYLHGDARFVDRPGMHRRSRGLLRGGRS